MHVFKRAKYSWTPPRPWTAPARIVTGGGLQVVPMLYDLMGTLAALQEVLGVSSMAKAGRRLSDQDAKVAADSLVSAAISKGTMDNVTAIVCLLPWG